MTKRIHPGDKALGAILADGWFSGYVGFGKQRDHYGKHTRFKSQLHLEYADGSTEIVATGTNWKAATGPIVEAEVTTHGWHGNRGRPFQRHAHRGLVRVLRHDAQQVP